MKTQRCKYVQAKVRVKLRIGKWVICISKVVREGNNKEKVFKKL